MEIEEALSANTGSDSYSKTTQKSTDTADDDNEEEDGDIVTKVKDILNTVFDVIIGIVMFLCFFALSSNMSANLLEQRKEIAVLRAIGMTKCRIRMLYFYEAIILVFSSSVLGIMIGLIVGYTMAL
jgi:ABC-type antimicrobial peptide transport system permease subunit